MATEIVKTIRSSGGDYTTLSAWEAALPASLVTADEQHTAVCYDDWPSGLADPVVISGSTTDATRFIKVTVASGHRHDGTTNHTGFYLKGDKGANDSYFQALVAYTQIEWLDVEHTRNTNSAGAIEIYQQYCSAKYCIGKCATTSLTAYAVMVASNSSTEATWSVATNCLAVNAQVGFRNRADATRLRAKYYNCTAVNCATGFPGAVTVPGTAINCVAHDCTTGFTTGWQAASGYNASSDTTATTLFSNSVSGIVDADFIDATGGDFHLASGSALIGVGDNQYSLFTDDIDGDIRPSSGAWDIGFDHYVASGPAAIVGESTITLGAATVSSAGAVALKGALSAALGAATLVAVGVLAVSGSGTLTRTLDNANLVGTGKLAIAGAVSATLSPATITATSELVTPGGGSVTATLADATIASAGKLGIAGTLSAALLDATLTAEGSAPSEVTLSGADLLAIADAVWGHADAIAAHAALDDILARVTC